MSFWTWWWSSVGFSRTPSSEPRLPSASILFAPPQVFSFRQNCLNQCCADKVLSWMLVSEGRISSGFKRRAGDRIQGLDSPLCSYKKQLWIYNMQRSTCCIYFSLKSALTRLHGASTNTNTKCPPETSFSHCISYRIECHSLNTFQWGLQWKSIFLPPLNRAFYYFWYVQRRCY